MKVCKRCGKEKPLEDFNRKHDSPDGRHSWCGVCTRTYWAEWAKSNPERLETYDARKRANAEVPNGVPCEICGAQRHLLGPHLRADHKMTLRAYRKKFPGKPTASENVRGIGLDLWEDRFGPKKWTRATIAASIREYAIFLNRMPTSTDWQRRRRRRGTERTYPTMTTILREFGSWAAAVEAAGVSEQRILVLATAAGGR